MNDTTGECPIWTAIYNEIVNRTADYKGNPITDAAAKVIATNIHKLFNAALAAEQQPLMELADAILAALKAEINYFTPQLCLGDIKRWESELAKVKEGK